MDEMWSRQYWERLIPGAQEVKFDRLAFGKQGASGRNSEHLEVSENLREAIMQLVGNTAMGRFTLLYAAVKLLMWRHQAVTDILIACPPFEPGAGHPGSFLFLRNAFVPDASVKEFLVDCQKAVASAKRHGQFVPWRNGQAAIQGTPAPLVCVTENELHAGIEYDALTHLVFTFLNTSGSLQLSVTASDAFSQARLRLYLRHLHAALSFLVSGAQRVLDEYSCMVEDERAHILEFSTGKQVELPAGGLFAQFLKAAEENPAATAVVRGESRWTYAQLKEAVEHRSYTLSVHFGIKARSRVAISLPSSFDLVVSYMAVLRLGATIVPIEPALPALRKLYYLEGCELLVANEVVETWPGRVFFPSEEEAPGPGVSEVPMHKPSDEDIQFILHTSGSTGTPKGVCVTHRSILNIFDWLKTALDLRPDDVIPQKTTINFVDSLLELLLPVTLGRSAVFLRPADDITHDPQVFLRWLQQINASIIQVVPSVYDEMVKVIDFEELKSLRVLIFSGEQLRKTYNHSFRMLNLYGASEFGGHSHLKELRPGSVEDVTSIGKLIHNLRQYILDEKGNLCPMYVRGEICVGGRAIVAGYRDNPELTALKFVPDPFVPGEVLYRTGDLGSWNANGEVEFYGRIDHQVKLHGVRVELSEIEMIILRHPSVREAVALFTSATENAAPQLLVCFTGEKTGQQELRDWCAMYLPETVIPSGFYYLDTMPKNASGKADRKALALVMATNKKRELSLPVSPMEEALVRIWCSVLQRNAVDTAETIFEQGVHSLNVTRLAGRIQRDLGMEVSARVIFQQPTIQKLAAYLEERNPVAHETGFTGLGSGKYYPLSPGQRQLWLQDKLYPGKSNNICFSCWLDVEIDLSTLQKALMDTAAKHEVLRTRFTEVNGEPMQYVMPTCEPDVETLGWQEDKWPQVAASAVNTRFSLSENELFKVKLLRAPGRTALLFIFHHIISDGWSSEIFIRELIQNYSARSRHTGSKQDMPPLRYTEFATWHSQWVDNHSGPAKAYWHKQLKNLPRPDYPMPDNAWANAGKEEARIHQLRLDEKIHNSLVKAAKDQGCTPFNMCLGAVVLLLSHEGRNAKVAIGLPVSGREGKGFEEHLGFFVNTVVFKGTVDETMSGREFLARLRNDLYEAMEHQYYPFDQLVSELKPERVRGRHPFFDVIMAWNEVGEVNSAMEREAPEINWSQLPLPAPGAAKFPLNFTFYADKDSLELRLMYDSGLFGKDTIGLLADRWYEIVQALSAGHDQPLGHWIKKKVKTSGVPVVADELFDDFAE